MPKQLALIVDHRQLAVQVGENMLSEAEPFFSKMDADMGRGWRMGPEYVERPTTEQRAQIAADRLLASLSSANETMVQLMAGYILTRLPNVISVDIDTSGEMLNTRFEFASAPAPATAVARDEPLADSPSDRRAALARAGQEVTAVYSSGKTFRFAVLDPKSGQWLESGAFDSESEAEEGRNAAFRRRYNEIAGTKS